MQQSLENRLSASLEHLVHHYVSTEISPLEGVKMVSKNALMNFTWVNGIKLYPLVTGHWH